MKVWEVKAQALKLMFADSDLQFNENEFRQRIVYNNGNTRDKLVRMEDSIKRAIDLYYTYVGVKSSSCKVGLTEDYLDLNAVEDFGTPDRVDVKIFRDSEKKTLLLHRQQINFIFAEDNKIEFEEDFNNSVYDNYFLEFKVYYKKKKRNLPLILDEMEEDLNALDIPEEVQRNIPYFIKAELYEEDEPQLAMHARNNFITFLMGLQKPFGRVQTKVKSAKVFRS